MCTDCCYTSYRFRRFDVEGSSDLPSALSDIRLSQVPEQHTAGWFLGRWVRGIQGSPKQGGIVSCLAKQKVSNRAQLCFSFHPCPPVFLNFVLSAFQNFNKINLKQNIFNVDLILLPIRKGFRSSTGQEILSFFGVAIPEMTAPEPHHYMELSILWILWRNQHSPEVAVPRLCKAGHSQAGGERTPTVVPGNNTGQSQGWLREQSPNQSNRCITKPDCQIGGYCYSLLLCCTPSQHPNSLLLFLTPWPQVFLTHYHWYKSMDCLSRHHTMWYSLKLFRTGSRGPIYSPAAFPSVPPKQSPYFFTHTWPESQTA